MPNYGRPRESHTPLGPLATPLVRATTFGMVDAAALRSAGENGTDGGFYPRHSHANGLEFESLVAESEGATGAVAFASGMGAISGAILALCSAGDRVLVADQIYGGTDALARRDLPRFGIRVQRFDAFAPSALEAALAEPAKLVVFESPINPTLRLVDVAAIAGRCRRAGAWTLFDGTFAPAPIQHALRLGVDLVVHSATKFFGGHSDVMGGVVAGADALLDPIVAYRLRTGGILAPADAWLLSRSMATLRLRLDAQQAAAERIAVALHAQIGDGGALRSVSYPTLPQHPDRELARRQMNGGGTLIALDIAGGLDGARRVFDRFRRFARGPSLGGIHSLATLPAYTTHASLTREQRLHAGIADGIVRLSIGIEDDAALLADIRQALAGANEPV